MNQAPSQRFVILLRGLLDDMHGKIIDGINPRTRGAHYDFRQTDMREFGVREVQGDTSLDSNLPLTSQQKFRIGLASTGGLN